MAETEAAAIISQRLSLSQEARSNAAKCLTPSPPFSYTLAPKYGAGASAEGGDSMARPINRLSARAVQSAKPGMHADGAGLYLLVTSEGTASWIFRYRRKTRLRDMGLGSLRDFTLAEARERAREARKALADGLDPIEHRRALRASVTRTWGAAVEEYIAAQESAWKNAEQAAQWRQSLTAYGPKAELPVGAVDTDLVLDCLRPIWNSKTETASRVRGRIERVWSAEKVKQNVVGENPARWRGHLDHLLPKPAKVKRKRHFAAMPYAAAPAFMAKLTARDGIARRALRFTILTAARTNETCGMAWSELDLEAKLWRVPASKMKGSEEHVVPLTDEALAILEGLPRNEPPFPISEGTMLALLQHDPPKGFGLPYTVHGFRSTFHDWASEEGDWPEHVIDQALAHKIPDAVKAAYRRGNLLAKRRELMEAWAAYLAGYGGS